MDSTRHNTDLVKAGSMPYVGMRPYRREEKNWFYGRSADGRIIADKTLAARLTLLYAPSGVGKSSVLNANTIPALEDDDCCVMYFDAWAGSDPTAAIKDNLAAMASAIGVVDPLAGAPTIAELVRLVTANGKTLVLVFDQFEEFLVNHANALDPLRKEVATLVRAQTIDARVLISLREEFLAALEPFRQEIVTLFQSTYRLEPLAAKDVEDAIVKPVGFFKGEVELALAERLIADLSEGQKNAGGTVEVSGDRTSDWFSSLRKTSLRQSEASPVAPEPSSEEPSVRAGVAATIDLPMLQLVCEQMWRAAPIADGKRKLSLDLYKNLGGKDKILSDHIRSCMPTRWWDRLFTAKLMRYLAPPSGMKISYSVTDLSSYSALEKKRVEAELIRLSEADARILRRREYRHEVRYELQHDALVRHIAPWRDAVLEKASELRWIIGVVAVLVMAIGLVGWNKYMHYEEVQRNTKDRFVALRAINEKERPKQAPATFENVADYLLRQEQGVSRLDDMKQLFEKNVDLLPVDYAKAAQADDALALVRLGEAPFVLRYSKDRVFDLNSFGHAWREAAQRLTRRSGIPVPQRIALIADPGLTENEMFLESGGKRLLSIDVENFGENATEKALVEVKSVVGPMNEFREHSRADWIRPRLLQSDDWLVVPRWSLPVWRVAGLGLYDLSAYPAFVLERELQKDPALLLTEAATVFLVKHVAAQYPCTAAETWKQRRLKLKGDLLAFVKQQTSDQPLRPLTHPHLVFDLLATATDDDEVRRLVSRADMYVAALGVTRRGDWPLGGRATADDCKLPVELDKDWDMTIFGDAQAWLPLLQPKLHLALGADLVSAWSTGSEAPEQLISQSEAPSMGANQTWGTSKH
ncbi:hypothetical protein YTPLAS72_11200 [Nitrospira sp.]|nr:hypothetical protein YTPLAS72_11200 [Nitrospira sp.]